VESRLSELQAVMNAYSDASLVFSKRIRTLGNQIVQGFRDFLGGGAEVIGVPPEGTWHVDQSDYRDKKFSDHGSLILIEPVSMGLAFGIPHTRDSGRLWLRIVLDFEPNGDAIVIWVGDQKFNGFGNSDSQSDLEPVYEAVFSAAKQWFGRSVRSVSGDGHRAIGFVDHQDKREHL
jgi:hypothetical protein